MAKKDLVVTLSQVKEGECTYVVMGADRAGGGHWGKSTFAYDALSIMLRYAGGIKNIALYADDDPRAGQKAIRFICLPHPPKDLNIEINSFDGSVSWELKNNVQHLHTERSTHDMTLRYVNRISSKRYYRKRQKMGLCFRCSAPLWEGISKSLCKKHAIKLKEYHRQKRIDRIKMGICTKCSEPCWEGVNKSLCKKHAIEFREYQRKRRIKRQKMGLCISCSEPLWEGESKCFCKKHVIESREYQSSIRKNTTRQAGIQRFRIETERTWASKNFLSLKKN